LKTFVTSTVEVPGPCVSDVLFIFLDQLPDKVQFFVRGGSRFHAFGLSASSIIRRKLLVPFPTPEQT
jgi:hypothetical protein